jgi:hypothetical protein
VALGVTLGVAADAELRSLLVALCFHQFFEGVALGARLLDSTYSGAAQASLALLFAAAAPIGIGAGAGAISQGGLNTSGASYLLTQGVSDGLCAGILLHIGFAMLIRDFPKDTDRVAVGERRGLKRAALAAGREAACEQGRDKGKANKARHAVSRIENVGWAKRYHESPALCEGPLLALQPRQAANGFGLLPPIAVDAQIIDTRFPTTL